MKKWRILAVIAMLLGMVGSAGAKEDNVKIKLNLENQTVIINLNNNSATQQFLKMLPRQFEFSDFAGEEKITYFTEPISLENAPRGMVAKAGKMFIYAPWKNWGIFYKDHGTTPDSSLIEMGEVESGLDYLANQHGKFVAYIEVCK